MANKDDILVHNLRDALRQAQQYILSGIVSALLALLVSIDAPNLVETGERVGVPFLGNLNPGPAAIILMFAYFVFGLLANSSISQIKKIIKIMNDESTADIALTYLSIVTIKSTFVRLGAILLPPLLLSAALAVKHFGGGSSSHWPIYSVLLWMSPYLVLAYRLLKPIKSRD